MRLGISTASWMLPNSLRIRLLAVASRALPTDFALVAISDCLALRKIRSRAHRREKSRRQPLPVYRSFPTHVEIPSDLSVQPVAQSQALSRTMGCGGDIGFAVRGVNAAPPTPRKMSALGW